MKPILVLAALLFTGIGVARSAEPEIVLWPEGVPNVPANLPPEQVGKSGSITHVNRPTLTVMAPEHPNGTAVIVCPGGGYSQLVFVGEGVDMAHWLNQLGITAFILKYRLGDFGQPAPLQDALRAIRTVRSQAARWHIDPHHVGIIGFSAGGHVAASAGTLFANPAGNSGRPIDQVEARPDFMMLVYPVITMEPPYAHPGSRNQLIGKDPSQQLIDLYSLEKQVTPQTSPTFLVATEEDKVVPAQNSLHFYEALLKAKVPAELHLYQKGPHGFRLRPGYGPTSLWTQRAADWMQAHGWLPGADSK